MSVFTKADIEIDTFTEYRKHGESIEDLYAYLEELKSQGVYVVEVTVNRLDDRDYSFHFHRSESLGFFKSAEEVESIKKEYLAKSTTDVQFIVDIECFEPLNESI